MRDIRLTEIAKQELVNEYGEKAIIVDSELNQLAKLLVKRKDYIKAFNKGNYGAKERYMETDKEIKKIIKTINKKI
ncbi:hypothetical protein [Fusobacterium periodonticum]|uniref:hypothetical protein n=1 Tax=Fusobacterium periodonticum TaxID=860 RepID=UPI00205900E3|nr:hypothetical protein [Fusobacterium periodonticum]DAX70148.1 MAG TPA: hypothetical protein [Caudoviricetes sp.]